MQEQTRSAEGLCCRNRWPCKESEVWSKLNDNISLLQQSLYLPTLIENLQRKGLIDQQTIGSLSILDRDDVVLRLVNKLVSGIPSRALDMCDALQETNLDIAEKVGLGPLPAGEGCTDVPAHSPIVKSYHAVLTISIEPHIHIEPNQLRQSRNSHLVFM